MPVDDAALERLLRVFTQVDDEGRPIFPRDEVRAFLPLLFLESGGAVEMSPALERIMREFASLLGLTADLPRDEVERRIRAHYEEHPPSPRLLAEVKDALRETLTEGGALDAAAAAKALGGVMAKTPVGHGDAPAGSMKASPLARFRKLKDDDET